MNLEHWLNFEERNISSYHRLLHGFHVSEAEARHSQLALDILLQSYHQAGNWSLPSQWLRFLVQSLHISDTVLRAVVCFGAACEAVFIPDITMNPQSLLCSNQRALKALRKEVSTFLDGPIHMFLASIVLAATEVLLRRFPAALTHTRGALGLLTLMNGLSDPGQAYLDASIKVTITTDYYEPLREIGLAMDTHTARYRLSEPPDLPQVLDLRNLTISISNIMDDAQKMDLFLHDCYHFTSRVAAFKYHSRAETSPQILEEQSRYIAVLARWLQQSRRDQSVDHDIADGPSIQKLTQKVLCLSTLIYISTILQPYECAYDTYAEKFTQIIDIAEKIMAVRHSGNSSPHLPRFQLQPGLFQPLYFTAIKYRHPVQRRRAVKLFAQLGQEGPWNAKIMAAVALKLIETEELFRELESPEYKQHPMHIPERARVHGCGLTSSSLDLVQFPIIINVEFSRCNNIEDMLEDGKFEEPHHWTFSTEEILIHDCV